MTILQTNYNAQVRKLIQELEKPLAEVEDVMSKLNELNLNLSDSDKEKILNNLKRIGDLFEPRKGQLKTLP